MENPEAKSAVSTVIERFRKTQERLQAHQSLESYEKSQNQRSDRSQGESHDSSSGVAEAEAEAVQAEGLSALPQPELTEESQEKPTLEWPVKPQFISPESPESRSTFKKLGVSKETCNRLGELGYKETFAVQTAVIPEFLKLQRRLSPDPLPAILVNSFTGSGKTLAYSVPIVDLLRNRRVPRLRALILLPTKVLIQQVYTILDQLTQGTSLRVMALKADRTLTKESQLLSEECPDIVVSAPGRLIEHLSLLPNMLSDLEMLVIDEADRLVGQSFQNWTEVLAKSLPVPSHPLSASAAVWTRPPQRLVFSATLTRDPAKLDALQIKAIPPMVPKLFVIGNQELDGRDEFNLPSQLTERIINVRSLADKPLVLVHELLNSVDSGRVIVFVRSNEAAARLARLISLVSTLVFKQHIEAARCSGEMRPQDRRRILKEFSQNASGVLVCTDMIARGMDMDVEYVINYDVPTGPREYVHRVGRTARAGAEGSAWTLVSPGSDQKHFWDLQQGISRATEIIESTVEPDIDEQKYEQALKELGNEVLGA